MHLCLHYKNKKGPLYQATSKLRPMSPRQKWPIMSANRYISQALGQTYPWFPHDLQQMLADMINMSGHVVKPVPGGDSKAPNH